MKNILIIAKLSEFENENSPNRLHFLNYLNQQSNIVVLEDKKSVFLNNWLKQNEFIFSPDIIIYYFLSKGERFTKIEIPDFKNTTNSLIIPCVMIFEDSHYIDQVNKLYRSYMFDYFIQLGYNKNILNSLTKNKIPFELWNQYIDTNKFKIET